MAYNPDYTIDYEGDDAFQQFYAVYPNGVGGDTKVINPKDGYIYQYDETNKTFDIIKTIDDSKDTEDQYYIYSSKVDTDAIRIFAEGGSIDIDATTDIHIESTNQIFKLGSGGTLSIKDDLDNDLMTVEKTGAIIKVPFTAEQGMDNQVSEEFLTIGVDVTADGNRTLRFVDPDTTTTQSITSITESTDNLVIADTSSYSNGNYIQISGTSYNDGIYQISTVDNGTEITINSSYNAFEQNETPGTANVQKIEFKDILYNTSNSTIEFSENLELQDSGNIGISSDLNLLTLEDEQLTLAGNLVLNDSTANTIGLSGDEDLLLLESEKLTLAGNLVLNDSTANTIGPSGDEDLITLTSDNFLVSGNIQTTDSNYIGSSTTSTLIQLNASNVTIANPLLITDSTSSTTKDTGSIITEGGVGIEENLNVGGITTLTGQVDINNIVDIQDGLHISGATADLEMTAGRYIEVDGNATLIQLNSSNITLNGSLQTTTIGNGTDLDLLDLSTNDVLSINGNLSASGINDGSGTTLVDLSPTGILKVEGNIQIDESANIGTDSDTDLLTLSTGEFTITGTSNLQTGSTKAENSFVTTTTTSISTTNNFNILSLSTGERVYVEAKIFGYDTGTTIASYHLEGLFYENASSITQVGSTISTNTTESNPNWDCDFSTSGTDLRLDLYSDTDAATWIIVIKYTNIL